MAGDVLFQGEFLNFTYMGVLDMRLVWYLDEENINRVILPTGNVEEANRQLAILREEEEPPDVYTGKPREIPVLGVTSIWDAIDKVFLKRGEDVGATDAGQEAAVVDTLVVLAEAAASAAAAAVEEPEAGPEAEGEQP